MAEAIADMPAFERLTAPRYGYAEADRIAGVTRGTTKRWIKGYSSTSTEGERRYYPAVTAIESSARDSKNDRPYVSFFDLVEVAAINHFRNAGVRLPGIRKIVAHTGILLKVQRPLVAEQWKVGGRAAFVRVCYDSLRLMDERQQARQYWDSVLSPFLETIEYEDGFARRWWPLGAEQRIVVDPDIGFGQPVVAGSGVRTESVLEQLKAGSSLEQTAYDFALQVKDVGYALAFESARGGKHMAA